MKSFYHIDSIEKPTSIRRLDI